MFKSTISDQTGETIIISSSQEVLTRETVATAEKQAAVNSEPTIEIDRDYDGYFEAKVRSWVKDKKGIFNHKRIIITAGPYRASAVTYSSDGDTLELDFYAAIRRGFGGISSGEIEQLIELL